MNQFWQRSPIQVGHSIKRDARNVATEIEAECVRKSLESMKRKPELMLGNNLSRKKGRYMKSRRNVQQLDLKQV